MVQDALAANRERLEIELEGKNRVLEAERLEAHRQSHWKRISGFHGKEIIAIFRVSSSFHVFSLFCF